MVLMLWCYCYHIFSFYIILSHIFFCKIRFNTSLCCEEFSLFASRHTPNNNLKEAPNRFHLIVFFSIRYILLDTYPLHHVSLEYSHKHTQRRTERINRPNGVADDDLLPAIDLSGLCNPRLFVNSTFFHIANIDWNEFQRATNFTVFFWSFDDGQPDGIVQRTKNIHFFAHHIDDGNRKEEEITENEFQKVFKFFFVHVTFSLLSTDRLVLSTDEKRKFSVQSFDHSLFSCS